MKCSEQIVAEVKRNLLTAFGPDWKSVELDLVALQRWHIFGGREGRALAFFKNACERGWLPYYFTADSHLVR